MYVGNLERYQGVNLLLDAFVHIFHHRPHVQLVIIGGSQEHVLQYRRRAERIGIGARTHFLGPQPLERLGNFLRLADVLVSPRVAGSNTPMKIFSYLESGKPVLATRLDTHTQVLDDDVSLLVEANPLEMARGMTALLDDEALRTRISRNARVRMRQRFSVQRLEAKLTKFYRELATTLSGQTC